MTDSLFARIVRAAPDIAACAVRVGKTWAIPEFARVRGTPFALQIFRRCQQILRERAQPTRDQRRIRQRSDAQRRIEAIGNEIHGRIGEM
jgi:hypothetical protein